MAPHMSTDSFHVACDCAEARASKTDFEQVISKNAGDEMVIVHDAGWSNETLGHDLAIARDADWGNDTLGHDLAIARDADWGNDTLDHDLAHHNHHNNDLYYMVSQGFHACAFPIPEGGFGGV